MRQKYRIAYVGNFRAADQSAVRRSVSFVIPAFQAASTLADSIAAIRATAPSDAEIVVVDDASFDETAVVAHALADQVVVRPCQGGAARCRNDGARVATGKVLFFVDADVIVGPGAVTGVLRHIEDGTDACFGAYTALPPSEVRNAITNYKNILHHYTHVRHPGAAHTFWSGFGAVRREAFEAVDGFDAAVTTSADVEDIDLGYRLSAAGFSILLDPTLQVQHRKQYTLRSLVDSDVRHRAVPWSRVILKLRAFGGALNVSTVSAASSIAAAGSLVGLVASPFVGGPAVIATVCLFLVWVVSNVPFLTFVERVWSRRGMLVSVPLLFLYSLSSLVGAFGGLVAFIFRQHRTSGLNALRLESDDEVPQDFSAPEVTVAVIHLQDGNCDALDALPPLEPWWELVVVGAEAPSNLPAAARFVPSEVDAARFKLARHALDAARGDFFALIDSDLVPSTDWLERVRFAAAREDVAVGGSFCHDTRGIRCRATQVAQFWTWRPECEAKWMSEHPLTNFGFRTDVARSLGGFQPALVARLNRLGARAVRFDPAMSVTPVGPVPFRSSTRRIGAVSRFQAASLARYFDISPLHRAAMIGTSPFSGLRALLGIVRSAVAEGSADTNFWLSLPLSTVALATRWIGRDLGLAWPRSEGDVTLRTPEELADVQREAAARMPPLKS